MLSSPKPPAWAPSLMWPSLSTHLAHPSCANGHCLQPQVVHHVIEPEPMPSQTCGSGSMTSQDSRSWQGQTHFAASPPHQVVLINSRHVRFLSGLVRPLNVSESHSDYLKRSQDLRREAVCSNRLHTSSMKSEKSRGQMRRKRSSEAVTQKPSCRTSWLMAPVCSW